MEALTLSQDDRAEARSLQTNSNVLEAGVLTHVRSSGIEQAARAVAKSVTFVIAKHLFAEAIPCMREGDCFAPPK